MKNNFEGLTPEQQRFIRDLNKRIQSLESKIAVLQAKLVKIDPSIVTDLANKFTELSLN